MKHKYGDIWRDSQDGEVVMDLGFHDFAYPPDWRVVVLVPPEDTDIEEGDTTGRDLKAANWERLG